MKKVQYSSLLYSLPIFLFLINAQAQTKQQVTCSSSCGEIKNISYPFRLTGDPSTCGDPDYQLSCVNNQTILEIFPGKYIVKNISYDDQTLRLVDTNFDNKTCSLPSASMEISSGYMRDFRFRGVVPSLGSRFRFVKCSTNISRDGYTPVPCLTRNGTYFYTKYDGDYLLDSYEQSCSLVSVAPVANAKNVTKFDSDEVVMEILEAGFDVGWSIVCRDCSLSGKSCVVKSWDKPLTYICEREYRGITKEEAILIILAIVVGGLIVLVVIIVVLVLVIRRCRRRRNSNKAVDSREDQQSLRRPTIDNP